MKRIILLVLLTTVFATVLTACISIEMDGSEDLTGSADISSNTVSEESRNVLSTDVSAPEESSKELVYSHIYPDDYNERIAYYGNMTLSADVNDVYFNNSVFVGNSIMLHYKNYVSANRVEVSNLLGDSMFFAAASFSLYNNKNQKPTDADCALPVYMGEKLTISQAVDKMQVKTVYLSLMALNDIALYKDGETGINETYVLFQKLVEEIKTSHSDVDVVVLSNTYLHESANGMKKLNNSAIRTLNNMVLSYCNENGYDFVDVCTVLIDDNGCLGTEFCSDIGSTVACHLNQSAYNAWTEILRDYAAKKAANIWINPTTL